MIPEIRLHMLYSQFIFHDLFQVNQQIINVLQVSLVPAGSQYVIATLSDIILIVIYELRDVNKLFLLLFHNRYSQLVCVIFVSITFNSEP